MLKAICHYLKKNMGTRIQMLTAICHYLKKGCLNWSLTHTHTHYPNDFTLIVYIVNINNSGMDKKLH